MDAVDSEVLQSYFGEYSPSIKDYRTKGGNDLFFHDVAKFLLEVSCVSPRSYCMPKQRVMMIDRCAVELDLERH